MTRMKLALATAATALAVGVAAGGIALAHDGRQGGPMGGGPMMGGGMMDGPMMGGPMMGGPGGGMMGGGHARVFEMFDADGDGTITVEEIAATREARFAETDADGDGTVSLDEFEALFLEMIRPHMVDAFQHLDADGDAAVTAEEFAAPIDRMAGFADRDGDGAIERGEMGRGMRDGGHRGFGRHHHGWDDDDE
ncbi:MAG: calcium-binding protein [Azospirillaceae bacterium]